jgi:hypothetical protein
VENKLLDHYSILQSSLEINAGEILLSLFIFNYLSESDRPSNNNISSSVAQKVG